MLINLKFHERREKKRSNSMNIYSFEVILARKVDENAPLKNSSI
jgi:hypothetical protein